MENPGQVLSKTAEAYFFNSILPPIDKLYSRLKMTEQTKGCSPHIADPAAIQLSLLQVHPRDNVLVVLQPLASGRAFN